MKKLMITLVAVFGLAVVATGFAATQSASTTGNHVASSVPPVVMYGANSIPPVVMY
ncbi:hypothetical protein PU629_00755 [Pullulanibacillus sp. KACC 23026]|uniref:hypothetical protein n=1 Tax=Pullulanibacillus sp. KACC 23026 TaxID=3028315 RepID=UPI0023B14A09|nr:hypothetical protein [Pullulanibacillus sp. KACC 23026]WEG12917.1 hypothetical protein PU629_00755 [Pullulanibacillus sp. KACC 23026]